MAAQNEVKIRVHSNALDLREFTVEKMQRVTGLNPASIRTELTRMKRDGYLTSKSFPGTRKGRGAPSHLYRLTNDEDKLEELLSGVKAFYQPSVSVSPKPTSLYYEAANTLLHQLESGEIPSSDQESVLAQVAQRLDWAAADEGINVWQNKETQVKEAYLSLLRARLSTIQGQSTEARAHLLTAKSIFETYQIEDGQQQVKVLLDTLKERDTVRIYGDTSLPHRPVAIGLGKELRWYRESQGLTQQELAIKAGVDHIRIVRLEDGQLPLDEISIKDISRLAVTLGFSVGQFLLKLENFSTKGQPLSKYLDFVVNVSFDRNYKQILTEVHLPRGKLRGTGSGDISNIANLIAFSQSSQSYLQNIRRELGNLLSEEKTTQDIGGKLFEAVFNKQVLKCYYMSQRKAEEQDKGLRVKLNIQSPDLQSLPWEFLYDTHQDHYLSLSRNTPVMRFLDLPLSTPPLRVASPLHILAVNANPHGLPSLNIEREKERLEEATKDLQERGLVKITWLEGATRQALHQAVRHGPWHVFYFSGHSGFDHTTDQGFISLADEEGRAYHLNADQLGYLLTGPQSPRLVLLNACEEKQEDEHYSSSNVATKLLRCGVSAVLDMQCGIADDAKTEFMHTFYQTLTEGMPIAAAVTEARQAVNLLNRQDWGKTVLYLGSQEDPVFNVNQENDEPQEDLLLPSAINKY